jgi:hypothetical protein
VWLVRVAHCAGGRHRTAHCDRRGVSNIGKGSRALVLTLGRRVGWRTVVISSTPRLDQCKGRRGRFLDAATWVWSQPPRTRRGPTAAPRTDLERPTTGRLGTTTSVGDTSRCGTSDGVAFPKRQKQRKGSQLICRRRERRRADAGPGLPGTQGFSTENDTPQLFPRHFLPQRRGVMQLAQHGAWAGRTRHSA